MTKCEGYSLLQYDYV